MWSALPHQAWQCRSPLTARLKFFIFCTIIICVLLCIFVNNIVNKNKFINDGVAVGWYIHTNRDPKIYVQPNNVTATHEPADICPARTRNMKNHLFLLIIVFSSTSHFNERRAIRETWAHYDIYLQLSKIHSKTRQKYKIYNYTEVDDYNYKVNKYVDKTEKNYSDPDFKVIFLLGLPSNDNDTAIQNKIDDEVQNYGDVMQESFIDSYYNLTLKSIMMLKWITSKCNGSVRYILKTDDDMFVNVPALVSNLRNRSNEHDLNQPNSTEYLLLGSLLKTREPYDDDHNKYYCPRYMYSRKYYPEYLSGTGYTMSAPAAAALYRAALDLDYFHIEDVYITGMCALQAVPPIEPRDDPMFTPLVFIAPGICTAHTHITVHKVPPDALRSTVLKLLDPATVNQ